MYSEFFGFRELPFNNTPDPRFFYSTPDHDEALASLIYAVQERKGFVLLTGEVGAGKTLVSRMMLRRFGAAINFATINHAVADPNDLLASVCTEFEIPYAHGASNTQMVRILHDFLLAQFAQDVPVVLVLDEAQNLDTAVFEQLRMIGNLEADDAKLLQIVILGQPELRATFASRELRQLRQRIFRSFHLPALSREHTEGYIRHRFRVVGSDADRVLEPGTIDRIYEVSQGLPRIVNTVCDNALLSAYSANCQTVGPDLIDTVADHSFMIAENGDAPVTRDRPYPESAQQASRAMPPRPTTPTTTTTPTTAPKTARTTEPTTATATSPSRPAARAVEPIAGSTGQAASRSTTTTAGRSTPMPDDALRAVRQAVRREVEEGIEAMTRQVDAQRERLDRDLQRFSTEIRQRVEQAAAGFRQLQADARSTAAELKDATTAADALRPLIQRANDAVDQVRKTADAIEDKDRRLVDLLQRAGRTAGEGRDTLDRMKQVAARIVRCERTAQVTLERLQEQSRRSRELADSLGSFFCDRQGQAGQIVRQHARAAGDVLASGAAPGSGDPAVDSSLMRSRKLLDEMRAMVRADDMGDEPGNKSAGKSANMPASISANKAGREPVCVVPASGSDDATRRLATGVEGLARLMAGTKRSD